MLASRMKAMAVRLRFSQSLAKRRQRLIQAMVRPTTSASRDDLEALGQGGALDHLDPPGGIGHGPAQLRAAVGTVGEDRLKGKGNSRRVWRSRTNRAPSRSCRPAGWTVTARIKPRVSTRKWRILPLTFLPASVPGGSMRAPLFPRFSRSDCRSPRRSARPRGLPDPGP